MRNWEMAMKTVGKVVVAETLTVERGVCLNMIYDIDCLLGVGIGIVVNHFVKSLLPVPLPLPITNFTN
jgi:hypothetical protein